MAQPYDPIAARELLDLILHDMMTLSGEKESAPDVPWQDVCDTAAGNLRQLAALLDATHDRHVLQVGGYELDVRRPEFPNVRESAVRVMAADVPALDGH